MVDATSSRVSPSGGLAQMLAMQILFFALLTSVNLATASGMLSPTLTSVDTVEERAQKAEMLLVAHGFEAEAAMLGESSSRRRRRRRRTTESQRRRRRRDEAVKESVAPCNRQALEVERESLGNEMLKTGSSPATRQQWTNLTNWRAGWCGEKTPDLLSWCKSEHAQQLALPDGPSKFSDVLVKETDLLSKGDSPCHKSKGGEGCKEHMYALRFGLHHVAKSDGRCAQAHDDDCKMINGVAKAQVRFATLLLR